MYAKQLGEQYLSTREYRPQVHISMGAICAGIGE